MPRLAPRVGLGVVYTPRDVCEAMVRHVLAPLVHGRRGDEILALRVCDPAVGEGAFAIEIVRQLADALGGPRARQRVAEHCLYGVDIDARAVAAACAGIEALVGVPVPALREHVRHGDALAIAWPCKFDALVGNPPYVRQEQLAGKRALRELAVYHGAADLYVYFIELAHRIARRYCLIVPNKWLTAGYGRPLRTLLSREHSVEGVVDLGAALPLFPGADAFSCIVWGGAGNRHAPCALRVRSDSDRGVSHALSEPRFEQVGWGAGPWHIDDADDAALLARLARLPTLGDVIGTRWSRGIVTGLNRAFVLDAAMRAALVAAEPAAAELIRPFLKGRDVRRWRAAPSDRFVLLVARDTSLAKLPRVRAHLEQFRRDLEPRRPGQRGRGRKPGVYRWFELQDPVVPLAKSRAPRLFYQDIQTGPVCCLDTTGELVPDTTVWILPSRDPFLLALLNSPLYAWYARRRFPPALNGAVRPKLEYMRALPIARPAPALRARIEGLVSAQVAAPSRTADVELADAIADAYELDPAERALVAADHRAVASRTAI